MCLEFVAKQQLFCIHSWEKHKWSALVEEGDWSKW
jgi:hypothetical protein